MELHLNQRRIAESRKRFRVICCGRRFGKTTLAIEEIKVKALSISCNIAYIAPTYQQARDIAWTMLKNELRPIIVKENESRLELLVYTKDGDKSLIQLRGWESIETLRGQQFDFLVIDEVAMMRNFWINWQEVIRPTLTDTRGEAMFISTPKGFNHFYDLYNLEQKDDDYKSFHFTSYDNPFIPKEELDKAKIELTEDRFAQEYMADFRKTEGLVYKEFIREKHLYEELPKEFSKVKSLGGVDFGFTNPAAILTILKDKDSRYWVEDEWYKTQQTDIQIADYASALSFNECYPDPESPSGIEELKRKNVNVREVIKNKDSIKNGINVVRELFKSNRLFINKRCSNLIWELETYSYPDKKADHNEEENPIKENDHAVDALRYPLMMDVQAKEHKIEVYHPTNSGYHSLQREKIITQIKNSPSVVRRAGGYQRYN